MGYYSATLASSWYGYLKKVYQWFDGSGTAHTVYVRATAPRVNPDNAKVTGGDDAGDAPGNAVAGGTPEMEILCETGLMS